MLKSNKILFFPFIICLFLFFHTSCKKEEIKRIIKVSTDEVSQIATESATVNGTIVDIGEGITEHGFCWSTTNNPTIELTTKTQLGSKNSKGSFTGNLTNLTPNTTYYIRSYGSDGETVKYSNEKSFITESETLASITTGTVSEITDSSAIITGTLSDLGNGIDSILQHGFSWSTNQNPTVEDDKTELGSKSSTGEFSSNLSGLSPGTIYYVRAYASNSIGIAYGNEINFTTSAILATVVTSSVSDITYNSAASGGNITDIGGATVTARGVCWGTSQNPTISDNYTSDGTGTGSFSSSITGLSPVTTYYVRAYATNSEGTAYGDEVNFTTTATVPTVTTISASSITENSAESGGNITDDGGATVTARGVCWSTSTNPTISDSFTSDGSGTGSFSSSITGLSAGTTYYVKAYATNNIGTGYGEEINFTASAILPTITTTSVSNIIYNSATSGGNATNDGGEIVTARGVCWSTSQNPTISDNFTTDGTGTGVFSSSLTGLSPATTYYVRAYATNSAGTAYGDEISFTTTTTVPTVTTISASSITENSAESGGNITDDGGATITSRGVCWSTSQNPTTADSITTDGTGAGSFSSNLTGLLFETTYYVRAYAINTTGTGYGLQVSFTTLANIPTVTTTGISNISENSAQGGGIVTDDGGLAITARGVCWSISQNPTTANSKTSDGTGTGSFSSNLTGLSLETTYYVRAYAINSTGTAYGSEVSFTSDFWARGTPQVTTTDISNITENSATSGGNVTSDGGDFVTARGVCWSTSQNPTISDNFTTDGTGTGVFSSSITGLSPVTTYYVRAYAINGQGSAYGSEVYFTTSAILPTLTTSSVSDITSYSATSGGNITDDGGATITARGVCWSTSSNPTTVDNKTTDGSGIGNFTSSLTGLSPSTTYYVRAYATNSAGTTYGNEVNFTTDYSGEPVTDYDGNTYNTVKIGTQWWMAENLKTTKQNDGTAIPLVTNSTEWDNLTTPGYCWYNNDEAGYKNTYGALYNWYIVNIGELCPTDWHVPTDSEWTTLTDYLGGESVAGGKLKETGTTHWNSPNTGATNESGFTALPGCSRSSNGSFGGSIGLNGYWWSSTEVDTNLARYLVLSYGIGNVVRGPNDKEYGFSVRCVRD